MRLAAAAQRQGRAWPMILEVGAVLWSGKVDRWDEGTHIAEALGRAGLDAAEMERQAVADIDALEALIAENEKAHSQTGHWGVPTMAFRGEPFFGQDRIDLLIWRLEQNGLQRREPSHREKA
jgi:2-hydroxychromene-2-carboxylate isomerase